MTQEYLPPEEWFDCWWDPAEFLIRIVDHNNPIPSDEFFCHPALKPLREAYASAVFANIRSQADRCQVRLVNDIFPDFELRFSEEIHKFELVEALHKGRRRGDEYGAIVARQRADLEPDVESFDPDEEEKVALQAIGRAITEKEKKFYAPSPHLLVYGNFLLFWELPITPDQAAELTEPWHDRFKSIWLLWGANGVRCWPKPTNIPAHDMPIEIFSE